MEENSYPIRLNNQLIHSIIDVRTIEHVSALIEEQSLTKEQFFTF